ncbi:unnamed protein product [Urochloa decumbens]|uniref:Exocyst subunit Exo70 family protein n=1 Tax=Urochloa decumbens TaxID=240449 RepID=A0ABC8Z830_9POAL
MAGGACCWRPWSAAARHSSTTDVSQGQRIRPREPGLEDILQDGRVRGGWFGHAAVDMEGRVHGVSLSRHLTEGDSSRLTMVERIREKALHLQSELDSIERLIVAPICLHPDSTGFFPHSREHLDIYITAANRLLRLETSGDMDRRRKSLLKTVMSSLAMEFCRLRVWVLEEATGEYSPATIWESIRRSRSNSAGSDDSWLSSSGSLTGTGSSDASTDLGKQILAQGYNTFAGKIYIDHRSVSILDDIAGVMIGAGYEHILRGAFEQHWAQLARYIQILDIDNILGGNMDEPREVLLKVWTSTMRIIIGFLSEMQRQLNAHGLGSFNELKEEYFLTIAKVSVMKLLNSASSICNQVCSPIDQSCEDSHESVKRDLSKMVTVLMMYQALNYGMPTILALFSGQTKEFILEEGDELIRRLSDTFLDLCVDVNALVKSQRLVIMDTGVHRTTRYIIYHMRLLVQQKCTINLILKGDFKAFSELVTWLILSLELMLNVNSRSLQPQGEQQIFLLNNMHFLLEEAKKNTDLRLILGENWLLQCHDQLDQCIAGYLDASWTPVMSLLLKRQTRFPTILSSHQLLYKFTSSFEMIYSVQKNWKVTDPLIRQKLRLSIYQKVIPLYRLHMENYSEKIHKSRRYNIEQIESQLLGMFEG